MPYAIPEPELSPPAPAKGDAPGRIRRTWFFTSPSRWLRRRIFPARRRVYEELKTRFPQRGGKREPSGTE
ncbi:MAG: hypothetical protein LBG87_06310 [Spirochaetaceae bacterium]|jgi:hypothetical protein|nr:hypothetical protein [Spirochaetaceae bacterium]